MVNLMVEKLTGSVMEVFKAQGHKQAIVDDFENKHGGAGVVKVDVPRTVKWTPSMRQ